MKRIYIFARVFVVVVFSLTAYAYGETDTVSAASTEDKSSGQPAKLHIDFEDGLITAGIAGASLKEVVELLEEVTGARFVLMGDQSLANEAIFARADKKPLEKALDQILSSCSYALVPMVGSDMPKVTIFMMKDNDAVAADEVDEAKLFSEASMASDPSQAAFVPYDLEEYMPLSEEMPGEYEREQYSEQDWKQNPLQRDEADLLSTEEQAAREEQQAAREERQQQARIDRALSALDSNYANLRSMAVNELTGVNDERATNALQNLAVSNDASGNEKRMAAQALWHHAGDLGFSDFTANQALRQLANGDDPSVRGIAERALDDMARYQRRSGK